MTLTLVGWFGTFLVLGTYAYTVRTGRLRPFNVGNVVGAVCLGMLNASLGAWPAVVLNATFGIIGAIGLWKEKRT
jgi:hypothetical protein